MLLLSSADLFFKIIFFKKLFQEQNNLGPDLDIHFVGPYLGPNCKCYQQMTKVAARRVVMSTFVVSEISSFHKQTE